MENVLIISVSFFVFLEVKLGCAAPINTTEISTASWSDSDIFYEDSTSQINLNNISIINDTELFLTEEEKASNLSERSLIFINKKLKTLRRIPLKNRYHGYQAFMPQSAPESHRWIVNDKIPQKFIKEKSSDILKTVQNPLFEPNKDIKMPQLQSMYRYVYPEQPKRNKSCMYVENPKINNLTNPKNLQTHKPERNKHNGVQFNAMPNYRIYDSKSGNVYNKEQDIPCKLSKISPELHNKNMVITSYTNRKQKSSNKAQSSFKKNCGFLKPNWFHRLAFNKNLEDKIEFNDVSNKEQYSNHMFGDEKLDRYIKEALSELQTQVQDSDNERDGKNQGVQEDKEKNAIDTSYQKLDELLAGIKK